MKDDPDIIKTLLGIINQIDTTIDQIDTTINQINTKPSPNDTIEDSIRKMNAIIKERERAK